MAEALHRRLHMGCGESLSIRPEVREQEAGERPEKPGSKKIGKRSPAEGRRKEDNGKQ